MHVSSLHVLRQGPMLATLGKTAVRALAQRVLPERGSVKFVTPGPQVIRSFAPLPSALLDEYVAFVGGDVRAYRGIVPAHFFPHWALPLAAATLNPLPYPIMRVLNAGCRMQVNAALPRDEPLHVRAQLTNVDDDGKRALLTQRVITGTPSAPDALIVDIYAFVPLHETRAGDGKGAGNGAGNVTGAKTAREDQNGGGNGVHAATTSSASNSSNGKPSGPKPVEREKPRIPVGAREIAFAKLGANAGLSFAKLTGDFNPIHWVPAYAKAAGFRNVILHGFGTFARCCEGLTRGLLGGDVHRLKLLDAKFTRPLVLPHDVGVYVKQREVFVGDGIEGPAYMTGRFDMGED